MNDVLKEENSWSDAWRYAYVLAGQEALASQVLGEAVADVRRRPDSHDPGRLKTLLFLAIRKRAAALPRNGAVPDRAVAKFHAMSEPGRTALTLLYLGYFDAEEIARFLDEDDKTVAEALERARAEMKLSDQSEGAV